MSDVGGTRTNPTFTESIQTQKGNALVLTDRISSVECPNCGFHVRAGHRPTVFCRHCKKEITVDTEYRYLQSSNKLGIKSLDWSYHIECYQQAVQAGRLVENQVRDGAILISQDNV